MTAPRRAANRHTITLPILGAILGAGLLVIASCTGGAVTMRTPAPTVTVTDPPHMATRIEKVPTTPISCRKALDLADRAHKITNGPTDARDAEHLAEVLDQYRTHRDQCRKTP